MSAVEAAALAVADDVREGVVMMDEAEARACVARARGHLDEARAALLDLYEREGWRALGYQSWRACAVAEFGQSAATLYRQLEAAQIARDLQSDSQVEKTPIPTAQLQPLRDLAPAARRVAWDRANELAGDGARTAAHVAQAASEIREEDAGDRAAVADAQRRFAALGWRLERHGLHYKLRDADAALYATGALALHIQTLARIEAMEARGRATESPPSPPPRAPTDDGAARRARGALMRATDATLDADQRERAHRAALLDAEAIGDAPLRIVVLEEITRARPSPVPPAPDPDAPPAARAARFVADQRQALARYDALTGVSQREHRQALSHIDALLDVIANGARGELAALERAVEATADALDDARYEALSRAAGALAWALAIESEVIV